jgi:aerobic carbon-monoxide dehydrogenase large subunit
VTGRYVGARVPRVNDAVLLAGGARFVDDISLPAMLHAAVVRSPVAHGRLVRFEADVARGVTVLGPEAFDDLRPLPILWRLGDQWQTETRVVDRHVRYVGQPLGLVVAASRYEAEDALDDLIVDIDEEPAVVDAFDALRPQAPLLYPERGTNRLATFEVGDDDAKTEAALAAADHIRRTVVVTPRLCGAPMECRGIVVDPRASPLTVWSSNQGPHAIRDAICEVFGLPQSRVRVITPAVGGGFGLKDHAYEDELMVVAAARRLRRPVKWIEDRSEAMVATTHARDEHFDVEVGYDDDGRLRALRVTGTRNTGAHFSIFGGGPLFTMAGLLPGPYRWDAVRVVGRLVATNRTPLGAYRGFGQTQAALVRERAVDLVAAALGRDPVDLRLQNMLGPDELPHTTATFLTYDNGDYPAALSRAREMASAWPAAEDDGRRRGVGICFYVQFAGIGNSSANEVIGLAIGGFETSTVEMLPDGTVRVMSGVSPHGQGLETTIAQLVADRLGVDLDRVELVTGDTEATPYSAYGTAASRSLALGGGAAVLAAERLAAKLRAIAADMLEAAADDMVLASGVVHVAGTNVGVPVADVARRAWRGYRLPAGLSPGLAETAAYDPPSGTFSYAAHVCRVAVDPDTGVVDVERYAVVHDCGTVVNPTIVEGQIHGGVAQGLGSALLESVIHDNHGQPLTTTFLDYLLPAQASMPDITVEHVQTPSPYTPGGMKGMGEGGTNGAMACVVNAVAAALPEVADRLGTLPLSPPVIWEALRGG